MIIKTFKPRFADLVESGSKLQTCRPTPRRMPKAGDKISLRQWTGLPYRSKQRVLRESTVVGWRKMTIHPASSMINLDGYTLGFDEMLTFAQADGFADHWDMLAWFTEQYGSDKWEGIVIYWT